MQHSYRHELHQLRIRNSETFGGFDSAKYKSTISESDQLTEWLIR